MTRLRFLLLHPLFAFCAAWHRLRALPRMRRDLPISMSAKKRPACSRLLKTPMQFAARLALSAAFSGKVEKLTPVVSRPTGDAMLQTWQVRAVEPLEGQAVSIDGLQNTMTDALVRIEFRDGYVWLEKLAPGKPSATIPATQSSWTVAKTYVVSGIEHILFGFDHLLFVASLMLIVRTGACW